MCFDARTERRRLGLAATCASVGDVGRDDLVSVAGKEANTLACGRCVAVAKY